jgi:hypothetical protein
MSNFQPDSHDDGNSVLIEFLPAPGCRNASFHGVVDVTDFGGLIGLEILDFRRQLDSAMPSRSAAHGLPRWSYDDEVDAFYVRVAEGVAGTQRSVVGTAVLDEAGRVTQIQIPS